MKNKCSTNRAPAISFSGGYAQCDFRNDLLVEPKPYNEWLENKWSEGFEDCEAYKIAKERVLFDGFKVIENNGNIIVTCGKISILFSIRNWVKVIEDNVRISTIEDLIKYNLTLTPQAQVI